METKTAMPLVRECDVDECAYNSEQRCHARAITVGDGLHPACDTFFVAKRHTGELDTTAGVGACKVSGCQHNREYECHAQAIRVGRHESHADCMTFSAT